MTLELGIYDVISYTIPGAFYLLTIVYALARIQKIPAAITQLGDPSVAEAFLLAAFAFVTGLLLNRVSSYWSALFRSKKERQSVFDELKAQYHQYHFKHQAEDWAIMLAYVRKENPRSATEINRFNALRILLKNVSFNLVILTFLHIVLFFQQGFKFGELAIAIFALAASLIAMNQSLKFGRWFYENQYETILAMSMNTKDFIALKEAPNTTPQEKETEKQEAQEVEKPKRPTKTNNTPS